MATSLAAYSDSALTTIIDGAAPLTFTPTVLNATPAPQQQIWIGSPTVGKEHRRKTLPGTNQLVLSVVDSNGATDEEVTDVKLALTEGGLATAVAGDPLDLGTSILSGVANAVSVWVEIGDSSGAVGTYTDISLKVLDVEDVPV